MKVIIVGAGRTGKNIIAKLLSDEKRDIVAIDTNGETLSDLMSEYDVQCVTGNGCDEESLIQAGINDADMFIAVTDRDEFNVLCCIVAGTFGVKNLIAHVKDPNYYFQFDEMKEKLGITALVNPEAALAGEVANLLSFPTALRVSSFASNRLQIIETKISRESSICGKRLIDVKIDINIPFLVIAVERGGEVIIPKGNTVISEGDIISVCAENSDMNELMTKLGFGRRKIRSVMILGCNDEAYYLADSLLARGGFSVKIIGKNYDSCIDIKQKLDKANVVCADFTDKEVLEREGLEHADALVAMSAYDENNIVAAFYAKSKGTKKVITVARKNSYNSVLGIDLIDNLVSPYDLIGDEIAKLVRSVDVPKDSQILNMQQFAGGKAEALAFNIGKNPLFVGANVRSLGEKIKSGILFLAVYKSSAGKGEVTIPDGDTVLEENDRVVIASMGASVSKLEDILRK